MHIRSDHGGGIGPQNTGVSGGGRMLDSLGTEWSL